MLRACVCSSSSSCCCCTREAKWPPHACVAAALQSEGHMQRCKRMAHKCVCISCGVHSDGSKGNFELHLRSAKHKHRVQLLRKHPRAGPHAQTPPPPGLQRAPGQQPVGAIASLPGTSAAASAATATPAPPSPRSAAAPTTAATEAGDGVAPGAAAAEAAAAGNTQPVPGAEAQPTLAGAGPPTTALEPKLSAAAAKLAESAAKGTGSGCGICKLQGKQSPAHFQVR